TDPTRLEILTGLTKRMVAATGSRIQVRSGLDQRRAVDGADFVLTQIRVGGQQARHRDETLGNAYGVIGQETVGVGGFAKALRTIPVVMEICRDVRKLAPKAWMINFTNPSGIVTEAISRHGGVKVIGLCNSPFGLQSGIAKLMKTTFDKVDMDYVGLNHLGFVRRVKVSGKDVTAKVLANFNTIKKAKNIKAIQYEQRFLDCLGMVPSSYLQYYYLQDQLVEKLQKEKATRAQQVMAVESELLKLYRDPSLRTKPEQLSKRGGSNYSTVAVSLVSAIANDKNEKHIVNVKNGSSLPDLPPDSVVEVPCYIGKKGATPLAMGRLEPKIRGLIAQIKAYEELTVSAAMSRSYCAALMALVNNPTVPSARKARILLDRLLTINKMNFR
ncbi:MAG: 6-phospho-beta-glucosidase, partial [candidate division FCPU426 bacterium]